MTQEEIAASGRGSLPEIKERLLSVRVFVWDELETRKRSYLPTEDRFALSLIHDAERVIEQLDATLSDLERSGGTAG